MIYNFHQKSEKNYFMTLCLVFGILAQFLGIEMIYKSKITENMNDVEKKTKMRSRSLGISILTIGSGLLVFFLILSFV